MSKKSTKRALLMSILSLLLCVSMLVGTTFAWFTDNVTSGRNTIQSGNLDVELEYYNGTAWKSVEAATDLFENELWEPGHTEVVYLRLSNLGSLALKYQLGINVVSEKAGTNVAGDSFKLSDYIHMGIVEGVNGQTGAYAKREDAVTAIGKSGIISTGYTKTGEMLKDANALYMAVVVYMPTTVGNEANYKTGTAAPTIDLGINLLATQYTYEEDSFGNDYDKDAALYNAIVTNEAELVAALAEAKNGDIIGISGNVTWTTGATHGSTPFVENASTYSLRPANNTLTYITLQGVDAGATFTAIGKGIGPVGIDNGTVIFKNLKIVDESVSYNENAWEFGYLEFRGNTVFENCNIVNAIMMEGDSATFRNCSFNSNADNQYAVWVSNGVVSFESCTFTGARGLKVHEDYGSEVVSVSVNNSEFLELSKKPGVAIGDIYMNGDTYTSGGATYTNTTDTAISLTNNKFIGTQPGDQGNYKYESDTDVAKFDFVDKNNTVVANNAGEGLYKDEDGVFYATTTGGLNAGIDAAAAGDTVVLAKDMAYTGFGYANITKDITLDLNGNTISTTSLGVVAKAGTIKNGTVTNPVGIRAALRTWSGVSIENVTVVSPKNGGITVASGNTLPYIKDVTIEAQTYGIELQYGASVGTIENVDIVAGKNGIVAQAATVGEIKNCTINGGECGVWAQLKGVYDLNLNFTNCDVVGGNYGIYMCDEGATIVPVGVAKLSYDDATTFEGDIKDKEFAFGQSGKLFINGAKVVACISTADELLALGGKDIEGMVILAADIDMDGAAMPTIGAAYGKSLTIVGNGHKIYNATTAHTNHNGMKHHGLFYAYTNSTLVIYDLIVEDVVIDATKDTERNYGAGIVVCYADGGSNVTLNNVDVYNCKVLNNTPDIGDEAGVYVGYQTGVLNMVDCDSTGCTVQGETAEKTGAFIGMVNGTATLTNCTTDLTIGACNRVAGTLTIN